MLSQIMLAQASMPNLPPMPPPSRGVPEGCFSSSGLDCLKLPSEVNFLGPLACENCKRLAFVDLPSPSIEAIRGSTFSHCVSLQHIWLPHTLLQIHKEAFISALREVDIPPTLRYIAHKAFLDCGQLAQFKLMIGKRTTWRGPYAEGNAFDLSSRFENLLPRDGEDTPIPSRLHMGTASLTA